MRNVETDRVALVLSWRCYRQDERRPTPARVACFCKNWFYELRIGPFAKGCRCDHDAVNKISRLVSMNGYQKGFGLSIEKKGGG